MAGSLNLHESGVELQVLTQAEIDDEPWKFIGYKGFATYVASDCDFFVLRRFDKLHTRVLLRLQDNLSELEEKLEAVDVRYSRRDSNVNNGTVRNDMSDRASLIAQIIPKLEQYDKLLSLYSDLKSRGPAPKTKINNVQNWFYNHNGAISQEETKFIDQKEDMISIELTEKTILRKWIEAKLIFGKKWLYRFFKREPVERLIASDKSTINYSSDEGIDSFIVAATFIVGLIMLIAPLWILQGLSHMVWKLGVITTFVVIFLGVLSFATLGRPYEILAATAAYSAVLVVFLQLGNSRDLIS